MRATVTRGFESHPFGQFSDLSFWKVNSYFYLPERQPTFIPTGNALIRGFPERKWVWLREYRCRIEFHSMMGVTLPDEAKTGYCDLHVLSFDRIDHVPMRVQSCRRARRTISGSRPEHARQSPRTGGYGLIIAHCGDGFQ